MKGIRAVGFAVAVSAAAPAFAAPDCYLGLTAASVFGRSQHVHSSRFAFTDTFDVNGRGVGAQFGCLAARDRWLYGAAVDLTDTQAKGNAQELPPNQDIFAETAIEWIGTMRAIGGYQLDSRTMVYLTGGLAFSAMKIRVCGVTGPFAGTCGVSSENLWGVVGGVGARVQLWRRWSLNAEYLAFGFENKEFPRPGAFSDRGGGIRPEAQLLRAGLSFHF